ncbi:ABC transporter ATP-binding protein [Naumannella sp. ID2617S]|nr:ABC transporter ATP-binding protein [Naumannella sp. ID2617S]
MPAILCRDVHRHFKKVRALDGVDLSVDEHQVFGLLGPNGSGKTTLLNQLQGLDTPTSGDVAVLGLDPIRDRVRLAERMGTQLQEATVIPRLTVEEALRTFASVYPRARGVRELLGELGLASKSRARIDKLSGGQRQRVFIALALLHDPELLFFDELTSALDPQVRLAIWDILRQLKTEGRTVVLTTHSMEEAQALCDRIAIMNAGVIVANGPPAELITTHAGGSVLRVRTDRPVDDRTLLAIDGVHAVERDGEFTVATGEGQFAAAVMNELAAQGVGISDMRLQEATLEDVFLALTGRSLDGGE